MPYLVNVKKEGFVSVLMEFLNNVLKKKGVIKDLEVVELSSGIDIMADKEEATTIPSNKNEKPPKATYNFSGVSKPPSSGETMANKEEATTPSKKHAKPPRSTHNVSIVVKRNVTTCTQENGPIKKKCGYNVFIKILYVF
jgi:hypothetical protein